MRRHMGAMFGAEDEDPQGRGGRAGGRGRRSMGPFGSDGPGERTGRGGPHRRGDGPGGFGPRGRAAEQAPDASDAAGWFSGRLPDDWFVSEPQVTVDRDEILIVGELPRLDGAGADAVARAAAEQGRIARFREDTRAERMEIARQAQFRYRREISWGARVGDTEELFTTASVPVMTRLRQPERQVLDTLVDSGVARSRSDALVWAVRLVGEHAESWLGELRDAMEHVTKVRDKGPDLA